MRVLNVSVSVSGSGVCWREIERDILRPYRKERIRIGRRGQEVESGGWD
jgi:hypothetical protein